MYLISLPVWDLIGQVNLDYNQRFDMIKRSLRFKSCRRNIICSYFIVVLEAVLFSVFIFLLHQVSLELLTPNYILNLPFAILIFYSAVSLGIYYCFDQEDYRRRTARILNEETNERFESTLNDEEVESSQEISVPTDNFVRR